MIDFGVEVAELWTLLPIPLVVVFGEDVADEEVGFWGSGGFDLTAILLFFDNKGELVALSESLDNTVAEYTE